MRYGRKAFGLGRKRNDDQHAKDIVASIRSHRAAGHERSVADYLDKDTHPELAAKVEALLQQA